MQILSSPWFLVAWAVLMIPSEIVLFRDLAKRNSQLMPLMKVVWALTVLYSGPLGLALYWLTGRKEIPDDANWRRAGRSVAHCYSGCGMGEVAGILIAAGLLSLSTTWVVVTTFSLAYIAGIVLTVGPMVQEGTDFREALKDAFIAETPSIAVMEAVAITTDILLAGDATMGEALFWNSLIVSLTLGLLAAYPVNLFLIRKGIKDGMMDPREAA